MSRRSILLGSGVAVPGLVLVDGLLGGMAYYATGSLAVGAVIFAVMFLFTGLELAIVAWAAKFRQDREARDSEQLDG